MAKNEAAIWAIIGAIVAVLFVGKFNIEIPSIVAAIVGAAIGYFFGKNA